MEPDASEQASVRVLDLGEFILNLGLGSVLMIKSVNKMVDETHGLVAISGETFRALKRSDRIKNLFKEANLDADLWPNVYAAALDLYEALVDVMGAETDEDAERKADIYQTLNQLREEAGIPLENAPSKNPSEMTLEEYIAEYGPACSDWMCAHSHCARLRALRAKEDEAQANEAPVGYKGAANGSDPYQISIPISNGREYSCQVYFDIAGLPPELHQIAIRGERKSIVNYLWHFERNIKEASHQVMDA